MRLSDRLHRSRFLVALVQAWLVLVCTLIAGASMAGTTARQAPIRIIRSNGRPASLEAADWQVVLKAGDLTEGKVVAVAEDASRIIKATMHALTFERGTAVPSPPVHGD